MEPPTKRLRIMQSVQVDESNPEYIRDRQLAQQQLKNKWELLFAKYEGMHESMTDEIDMRAGTVVIDRGHCRRLERQLKTMRPRLLDEVVGDNKGGTDEDTDEESNSEEDELAPTQSTTQYDHRQRRSSSEGRPNETPQRPRMESSPPTGDQVNQQQLDTAPGKTMQPADTVTNTPNVPSNLLSLVQFPETPQGQQAQSAFLASLTQTINQAVQQAVTPILSNLLANTPNVQAAVTDKHTSFSEPARADDAPKPSSDPRWYFPPIPETPLPRSLPQPTHKSSIEPSWGGYAPLGIDSDSVVQSGRDTGLPSFSGGVNAQRQSYSFVPRRRNSSSEPDGEDIPFAHGKKYHFTLEDDIYLSEQKTIHGRTFREIRDNTPQWKHWPIHALMSHWARHVRKKNLHLQRVSKTNPNVSKPPVNGNGRQHNSNNTVVEASETSARSHFPTPSSLGQGDQHQTDEAVYDNVNDWIASGGHYDNDELDLLSMPGVEPDNDQAPTDDRLRQTLVLSAGEHILPSVETNKRLRKAEASWKIQQLNSKFRNRQVVPDSEDDPNSMEIDMNVDSVLGPDSDSAEYDPAIICDLCSKVFGSQGSLMRHQQKKLCPKRNQTEQETDSESDFDIEEPVTVVFCDLCNAIFNCQSNLHRHREKNLCPMRNQSSQGNSHFAFAPKFLASVTIGQTGTPRIAAPVPTPQRARGVNSTVVTPTALAPSVPNAIQLKVASAGASVPEIVTSIETSAEEVQMPYTSSNESIKEEAIEETPCIPSSPGSKSGIDDELQAPRSPSNNSDFPTPPPPKSSFSSNPFQTPRARPRPAPLPSSGAKSTSSLGRKSFLQQVKQSWAKKRGVSSPGPKSVPKRKSLPVSQSKRKWADDDDGGDSADELGF